MTFQTGSKEYQTGFTWRDCIDKAYLATKWQDVRDSYDRIIALRDELRPGLPIFTHSYDFAAPTGAPVRLLWLPIAGGWLQEKFEQKNIPATMHGPIITYLLEEFAKLLDLLEDEHSEFIHIRTQGTLAKDEWGDELHPSMTGYKKIAAKFQAALQQRFPSLPSPA